MARCLRPIVDQRSDLLVGPFRVTFTVGSAPRTDEYRLRYQVFVDEHGWLTASPLAGGMEIDEFDDRCGSFLLTHVASGEAAGCQRLILPDRLPPGRLTNVEQYRPSSGSDPFDLAMLPRQSWAEVSRTTIAPKYRWGSSATPLPAMIAIRYASIALAVALNRTTLLSLSEPRTARLIRRLGFPLHQIGPTVDFHGRRAPFRIDLDEVLHSVPSQWQETLDQLIDGARRAVAQENGWPVEYADHAA